MAYDEADLADGPGGVDNAFGRFYSESIPWIVLQRDWRNDLAIPVLHVELEGGTPIAAGMMAASESAQMDVNGLDDGNVPIEVFSDTIDASPLKPLMQASSIQQVEGRYVIRFATPLAIEYYAGPRDGRLTIHDPEFAFPAGVDLTQIEMRYVTLAGWLDPAEFKAESEYYLRALQSGFCELFTDPNTVTDLEIGTNTGTCNAISFGVELYGNRVAFGPLIERMKRDPPGQCVPSGS
ncbi:MAG: hypothetical protein KC766_27965 [Myxococcales bacterium]|nr:hypothetical protein [Myxococcales bacterium]